MKKRAVLVTFTVRSCKFRSAYERNKFFRGLYGWRQVVRKEIVVRGRMREKAYVYKREGLLDRVVHEKIDQSSFIVPEEEFRKIENFMREWRDKVMWKAIKIVLEDEIFR